MIPISPDQKLTHEVDGVEYSFHPPVGENEKAIFAALNSIGGKKGSAFYDQAVIDVEAAKKGSSFKKGEKIALIKKRVKELTDKESGGQPKMLETQIDATNEFIDMVLCGWKSDNEKVAKFPKDGKPSTCSPFGLKNDLMEWYTGELGLSESEAKN